MSGPEPNTDLTGRKLGEYDITARIGVGGMGVVYEGRHPLIGKRVAVKVLLPALSKEHGLVERFLAEARAVNEIRHRGIVDIFSFGQLPDGTHYFVMEYLDGEGFDRIIKQRAPLSVGEALQWIEEVLDALEAAHQAGIVHRDIKPSNLFLVDTGRGRPYVKLLDFGIAKLGVLQGEMTPQTQASVIIGTPDYMSPEQARGRAISPATDLYAVACVLFELLTAHRLFRGENSLQTMWSHVDDQPPLPSSLNAFIPSQLDDVILWALEKDPQARPSSAEEMRQHLAAIRAALPPELHAPTPAPLLKGPGLTPPPISARLRERATPSPSGPEAPLPGTPPPGSRRGATPAPASGRHRVSGPVPPPRRRSLEVEAAKPHPGTSLSPLTALERPERPAEGPAPAGETGLEQTHLRRASAEELEAVRGPPSATDGQSPFAPGGPGATQDGLAQVDFAIETSPEYLLGLRSSRTPLIIGGAVVAVVLGLVAYLAFGGDTEPAPIVATPISGLPKQVEPRLAEPKVVEPKVVDPTVVQPKVVDPTVVEPKVVDPTVVDPKVVEPKVVEPKVVEPKVVEPKVVEPKVVEPKVVERRRGPSQAQLQARLEKLEARLAAKEAERGDKDRIVRQFIDQARQAIRAASTDQERREVLGTLDEISRQLGR